MNGQFLGTRFCRLWTFKVTFYWGSGSRAGMVAAASGRAHSEGAFPTPPLLPPHSQPLDKPDGFGQQRPPSRSSSPQHPPPPSCWASPMPQCTRDPGREPLEAKWPPEDDPAGASPHPLPQQCHMAAPTRRAVHPAAETQGRVAAGTG